MKEILAFGAAAMFAACSSFTAAPDGAAPPTADGGAADAGTAEGGAADAGDDAGLRDGGSDGAPGPDGGATPLVQVQTEEVTGAAPTVTFTAPARPGDYLVLAIATKGGQAKTVVTNGRAWISQVSTPGPPALSLWILVADGSESNASFTQGPAGDSLISLTEWSGITTVVGSSSGTAAATTTIVAPSYIGTATVGLGFVALSMPFASSVARPYENLPKSAPEASFSLLGAYLSQPSGPTIAASWQSSSHNVDYSNLCIFFQ